MEATKRSNPTKLTFRPQIPKPRHPAKRLNDKKRSKTRVNIGDTFERWRELREKRDCKTDAELADFLLNSFSRGGPFSAAPGLGCGSSTESCDSENERNWDLDALDDCGLQTEVSGMTVQQRNGQTVPEEIEIVLTRSMVNQPSAVQETRRKDISRRSSDTEGNLDLTESGYVDLKKEVLLLLMFRCLDCSKQCRVWGKGKGGNLTLRQECTYCCNCRVWTSRLVSLSHKVAGGRHASVGSSDNLNSDQTFQESNLSVQSPQHRGATQDEAGASGNIQSFIVKQEAEDDQEKETESLLLETFEDNALVSPFKKDSVEDDGLNDANVLARDENPGSYNSPFTAQIDEDGVYVSEEMYQYSSDEYGPIEEGVSTTESDEEEEDEDDDEEETTSERDWTSKPQKVFQNTIKPIIWCIDCGAVVHMSCKIRRHQKIYGCAACGTGDSSDSSAFKDFSVHFSDVPSFHKHAIDVHGAKENLYEQTVCPDCNRNIRVQTDPKKKGHVCEYKTKPFSCHLCPKRFITEIGQKVHYRRLHGEYTHICKYCMTEFDSKISKLDHELTHDQDELPFICPDCPEKFKDYITRNQHLKSHRGQKKHICSTCARTFNSLQRYERHMLIHSGEKPYRCEICERSFNQCGHLKSHMRLHTGEKPFMCEQCGECFNHNVSLKNHLVRQHGSDPAAPLPEENPHKGRPSRTTDKPKRRKRRRKVSSSAGSEDPEMEETDLKLDQDSGEESRDTDSSGEEEKTRKKAHEIGEQCYPVI
ncbi:uncharacterized protein [Hoplias malabaricus]|uniref:uncharacterized protein isoform X1 n=1 Tax=Hoplias malabaricus TaxID=27720 RepID=UPI003462CC77